MFLTTTNGSDDGLDVSDRSLANNSNTFLTAYLNFELLSTSAAINLYPPVLIMRSAQRFGEEGSSKVRAF